MSTTSRTLTPGFRTYLNQRPSHDPVIIMILSAVARFESVREAARPVLDVFPTAEVNVLAAALVTGGIPDEARLRASERDRLRLLVAAVAAERLPDSAEWGLRVLRRYVRDHYDPLLIAALHWAGEQVQLKQPLAHIRKHVDHAFGVALGEIPLASGSAVEVHHVA